MLDSAINVNKKHYPQKILEECKHEIKNTKMENVINDDLESSSSHGDNESDNESDNETENDDESKKLDKSFDNESNE